MSKDKFDFSEEFRTSRVQTIARGELFWTEVDILDLSDTQTANVLKATLENYGIKTNYFPAALAEHLDAACDARCALVIGTTGLPEDSHAAMELTSAAVSLLAMRAMQSGAWARRAPRRLTAVG